MTVSLVGALGKSGMTVSLVGTAGKSGSSEPDGVVETGSGTAVALVVAPPLTLDDTVGTGGSGVTLSGVSLSALTRLSTEPKDFLVPSSV